MKKTIRKKFNGKTNNVASVSLAQGKYVGQKISDEFTNLFRVSDLLKAGVKPAVSGADWSPMDEPTEANMELLTTKVNKPDEVILTDVLNVETEVNDTIAVPDAFLNFANNRHFYYDVDKKGRAKVNLTELDEQAVSDWKANKISEPSN